MFINPKIVIENGWVTFPDNDPTMKSICTQPNAIDFTLDRVFTINKQNTFIISEKGKKMRGGDEIEPVPDRSTGDLYWNLYKDAVFDGMSNMYVSVPDGVAAYLIIRSTFNRNGIFITSGLYDAGFQGHIGFAIHNRSGEAKIGVGTRIGQIIFVESENALMYSGGWNHEKGTHYTEN
jgi:deoxycytidine triphosphate deaminase